MGIFNGETCKVCQNLGVTCQDPGVIGRIFGQYTNVYLDGERIVMPERISDCPVIIGQKTSEEVVRKIRKNREILRNRVKFKMPNH